MGIVKFIIIRGEGGREGEFVIWSSARGGVSGRLV